MTFMPCRVQLNENADEIMKKKELLEDLQPDNTQTCKASSVQPPSRLRLSRNQYLFLTLQH